MSVLSFQTMKTKVHVRCLVFKQNTIELKASSSCLFVKVQITNCYVLYNMLVSRQSSRIKIRIWYIYFSSQPTFEIAFITKSVLSNFAKSIMIYKINATFRIIQLNIFAYAWRNPLGMLVAKQNKCTILCLQLIT